LLAANLSWASGPESAGGDLPRYGCSKDSIPIADRRRHHPQGRFEADGSTLEDETLKVHGILHAAGDY